MTNDYSQIKDAPSPESLSKLSALAAEMQAADAEVARLEAELKVATARFEQLAERDIPELMDQVGLETFRTSSGLEVEVARKVRASIPAARRDEAFGWLEQRGHGGMIKRTVVVGFRRDQQDEASALAHNLGNQFPNVRTDQKVEPSTLTAFVREQLDRGLEIPMDLFGVDEWSVAQIKTARKRSDF